MDGLTKYPVVFTQQADADRDRIIDELIATKPLQARSWLDAYERIESLLGNNPYMYQEHVLFVRRAHFQKYPYTVYYIVDEVNTTILIMAILHQKQDPGIILERLNIEF